MQNTEKSNRGEHEAMSSGYAAALLCPFSQGFVFFPADFKTKGTLFTCY